MAKITDFNCVDERGRYLSCDAFGNNVAFKCPACGAPVLAIVLPKQRGSDADHAVSCRECGSKSWVSIDASRERLVVQSLATQKVKTTSAAS